MAKLFQPDGKTPEKMLDSFIREARKILAQIDTIKDREKVALDEYQGSNPRDLKGLTAEKWSKLQILHSMVELGKPPENSYEYHELRRSLLQKIDDQEELDALEVFLQISPFVGMSPLYKTIWAANDWLEMVYDFPTDPTKPPKFEPALFEVLKIDAGILSVYVAAYDHFGELRLLEILGALNWKVYSP